MGQYSVGFREQAVQKFHNRGSKNREEVAKEVGVTRRTLYNWSKLCANSTRMNKSNRRPQDWSAAEKLKAVIEFEVLAVDKRGEFLRSNGLHSEHIEAWKKSMQDGLESGTSPKAQRMEMSELRARNKELERDLNRKDKALAETTALLVLKKKADLIWGTGDKE